MITSTPVISAVNGQLYLYLLTVSDSNTSPILNFSLPTHPEGMTIDARSGLVRWMPANSGTQTVVVKVQDQYGASAQQSFMISVTTAEPPVAIPSFRYCPLVTI